MTAVAISPDGKTIAGAATRGLHFDGAIRLWDATTGELKRTVDPIPSGAISAAFSPDGKLLAVGTNGTGYEPRDIRIQAGLWDVESGNEKWKLLGHTGSVKSVAFSPDGNTLACGSYRDVKLWDVRQGTLLKTLNNGITSIAAVAFSSDGKLLFEAGGRARMWDVQTGELMTTIKSRDDPSISLAVAADGKMFAIGTAGIHERARIMLFALPDFDLIQSIHVNRLEKFPSIAFSPDGKILAAASSEGAVKLWNVQSGELARTLLIPE